MDNLMDMNRTEPILMINGDSGIINTTYAVRRIDGVWIEAGNTPIEAIFIADFVGGIVYRSIEYGGMGFRWEQLPVKSPVPAKRARIGLHLSVQG